MAPNAKPPRVAIGALLFEGNTFSPNVTRRPDFASKYLVTGDALVASLAGTTTEMGGALQALRRAGATVAPLLATHGGAGGTVAADCYKEFIDTLLTMLRAEPNLDGVYLALHGAFITDAVEDVEGELLNAVREIVGDKPIVASCDLHAHITPAMLRNADALIGYQHYPHDDTYDRGEQSIQLLLATIAGEIKPLMVGVRAPMLFPPQRQKTTGEGPMVDIRLCARALERAPVLAASYFSVQPWLDFADVGFSVVVVANADEAAAEAVANELVRYAWSRRHDFLVATVAPRQAIESGLALPGGPVVLSEVADCVGGGATGDSAVVLEALLEHAPDAPSTVHIVDPEVVQAAASAGSGSRIDVHLGNKLDPSRGHPIAVSVEVERVFDGRFTYSGGLLGGVEAKLGRCAVLRAGAVEILVSTSSSYEYASEHFLAAGIDPSAKKFVVVKNPMNYRSAYPNAVASFDLATPGPTTPDLASLPWSMAKRPLFPLETEFEPSFENI